MISEAYRAAMEMKIGIDYDDDSNMMHVWTEEDNSLVECKKGTVAKTIGTILEKRHYNSLLQQTARGIQFDTFRNSQNSNFYVGNGKAPLSNSIIRFALRARNDTLWTPAKKAALFGNEKHNPYCSCGNSRVCNLLHVLNNCNYHMTQMTERHNMVQDWIKEAVKKNRKLK
jgi:hypothetical protein